MKYLVGIIIILFIALISCTHGWMQTIKEKDRLKSNQEALLSDIDFYKTESGKNAASVQILELSKSELEKNRKELARTIAELGIKLKRVESTSTSIIKSDFEVVAPIKDSTVKFEPIPVGPIQAIPIPVRTFEWKDEWVYIYGIIRYSDVSCNVQSVDTLAQVVHRVPNQFWFIKWGTKAIRQEMVNKNPHNKIVYTEYIELKK
jgi:hypothetical protein